MRGAGHKSLKQLKEAVAGKTGPNGRGLCVWCHQEVSGKRRNWCSDTCVEQYKLQGDWTYICRQIYKRDKGVCQICGLNTMRLRKQVKDMARVQGWAAAIQFAQSQGIPVNRARGRRFWDADHTIPCAEGGRDELNNLRTLCYPCHLKQTKLLQERLRAKRNSDV